MNWTKINWNRVDSKVLKLQRKITEAVKNKDFKKVAEFQRILTSSIDGRLLAVKQVTTNPGKNTPGIDGVIWSSDEAKKKF